MVSSNSNGSIFNQPFAHSDERVQPPKPSSSLATDYTSRLIEILKQYANSGDSSGETDGAQNKYTELAYDLWDGTGYGPAGDSNSVWGVQERLCEQPERPVYNKQKLIDDVRSLGWIIQDKDPYQGPESHIDGLHIFIPKLDRYLPYNHHPNQDFYPTKVKVIDYRSEYNNSLPYDYAIAAPTPILSKLSKQIPTQKERLEYGHIYPDTSLGKITSTIKDNNFSFSVHQSSIDNIPEYEYFPREMNVTEVVSLNGHPYNSSHKYHKYNPETGLANCGTLSSNDDLRFLSEQTMKNGMKNFQSCQHPACN